MNIGLDWDNTFTRDTKAWQRFVDIFTLAGHRIWIVTARGDDTPIEFIPNNIEGVVYCNFRAKKLVTARQGIAIDVWCDDDPKWINESFADSSPVTGSIIAGWTKE